MTRSIAGPGPTPHTIRGPLVPGPEGLYNQAVPTELFGELKSYVRFGEDDARRLGALAPVVEPHLPRIVERFYQTVLEHAGTRQVLAGGGQQVDRLRAHLTQWLRSLFGGRYDDDFVRQHDAIGRTHVRIGLPQRFLLTALEVIWQELSRVIRESGTAEVEAALEELVARAPSGIRPCAASKASNSASPIR